MQQLTSGDDDVLSEFMERMRTTLTQTDEPAQISEVRKPVKDIGQRLNTLLDMRLTGKISIDMFEQKRTELESQMEKQKAVLTEYEQAQKALGNIEERLQNMQSVLEKEGCMKEFDRQVFESICNHVIVRGYDENGDPIPYRITFIYRTGEMDALDGEKYRVDRRHKSGQ